MEIAARNNEILVTELLEEAQFALRYFDLAQEYPDASSGLLKMSRKHLVTAATITSELLFRGAGLFERLAVEIYGQDADTHAAPCPVPGMPRR